MTNPTKQQEYLFLNSTQDRFFGYKTYPELKAGECVWRPERESSLVFSSVVLAILFEDHMLFEDFLERTGEKAVLVYGDTLQPVFPPG